MGRPLVTRLRRNRGFGAHTFEEKTHIPPSRSTVARKRQPQAGVVSSPPNAEPIVVPLSRTEHVSSH